MVDGTATMRSSHGYTNMTRAENIYRLPVAPNHSIHCAIELFLHGISLLVVLSISVRSVRKIFVIVC
jgi:hypothetical protein